MSVHGGISRSLAAGAIGVSILTAWLGGLFPGPRQAAAQSNDPAEISTQEGEPTFRLQIRRDLVLVRVVVRDSKGRAVGTLGKVDFRLLDNGKPQIVSHFAVEVPASRLRNSVVSDQPEVDAEALPETALAPLTPQRYLALFFDDVHMKFEDLARTRDAANRFLETMLQPGDRVGIFTASGQNILDFTDDRAQLHEKLLLLRPRPIVPNMENACPAIFDYQAYLIVHHRDPIATEIATEEAFHCRYEDSNISAEVGLSMAKNDAESDAFRVLNFFETESGYVLRGLGQLVGRMAALPGQRGVVLVSPGFLTVAQEDRLSEIIERALRSNVIISSLDAKGLFAAIPLGDVTRRSVVIPRRPDLMGKKAQLEMARLQRASDPLSTLAMDTGGEFFQNSNDLEEGFRKVGSLPEVYYVLGFSPQNLKADGRFHSLKVTLANGERLTVQARRGYYAPKKLLDASAQAKEEIEQAIFSQDELNELPIEVHTQFFKLNELDAKLSVVTRLDLRFVRFRREEGRNLNKLTFATALFDRDGRYMKGKEKLVEFRLQDVSLQKLSESGITVRTSFDVKSGTYLVRQVVRDAEGAQLSGLNRTVEIPF